MAPNKGARRKRKENKKQAATLSEIITELQKEILKSEWDQEHQFELGE